MANTLAPAWSQQPTAEMHQVPEHVSRDEALPRVQASTPYHAPADGAKAGGAPEVAESTPAEQADATNPYKESDAILTRWLDEAKIDEVTHSTTASSAAVRQPAQEQPAPRTSAILEAMPVGAAPKPEAVELPKPDVAEPDIVQVDAVQTSTEPEPAPEATDRPEANQKEVVEASPEKPELDAPTVQFPAVQEAAEAVHSAVDENSFTYRQVYKEAVQQLYEDTNLDGADLRLQARRVAVEALRKQRHDLRESGKVEQVASGGLRQRTAAFLAKAKVAVTSGQALGTAQYWAGRVYEAFDNISPRTKLIVGALGITAFLGWGTIEQFDKVQQLTDQIPNLNMFSASDAESLVRTAK
jgi:hypothetical protein